MHYYSINYNENPADYNDPLNMRCNIEYLLLNTTYYNRLQRLYGMKTDSVNLTIITLALHHLHLIIISNILEIVPALNYGMRSGLYGDNNPIS